MYTMEYYSAIKKNEIVLLQQYGWIERLSDEVKLSQKERQIPYDITYM